MTYYYTSGTTTPWEHVPSSEATARHLRLGPYAIWARLLDGTHIFLVLPTGQEPHDTYGGYHSIDTALRWKGLR